MFQTQIWQIFNSYEASRQRAQQDRENAIKSMGEAEGRLLELDKMGSELIDTVGAYNRQAKRAAEETERLQAERAEQKRQQDALAEAKALAAEGDKPEANGKTVTSPKRGRGKGAAKSDNKG